MSITGPLLALERGIEIPDAWFTANPNGIFWIEHPTDPTQNSHNQPGFQPRSIVLDGTAGAPSATIATVRGILHGENEQDVKTRVLATHIQHARRYRAIYASGTTARGIEINA